MNNVVSRWTILAISLLLVAGVAAYALLFLPGASAQSSDAQIAALREEVAALREQLDALTGTARAANVLLARVYLAAGGFHAMDDALAAGDFDPRYQGTVEETLSVIRSLDWPEPLQQTAAAFEGSARDLAAALAAEDIPAAARAAELVHGTEHELSHAIFEFVAGGSGPISSGDHAHDQDSGHATAGQDPDVVVPEGAVEIELELADHGGVAGGATTHSMSRGDTVAIRVSSAVAGELHLHGFDHDWHVETGEELVALFDATATGRFPMEFHPSDDARGVVVGYLEVRP